MLDRYLLGALRPDEEAYAKAFFSHRLLARVPAWLREWAERDTDADAPNASQNMKKFWAQIRDHDVPQQRVGHDNAKKAVRRNGGGFSGRPLRGMLWTAGLTVVAVSFAGLALFTRHDNAPSESITRVYTTRVGQQAVVTLDDGTRVTLSPRTTLRLARFGVGARTVVLDSGEAYFNVARAAGAPFLIRAGATTTYVLGTEFFMRHQPHEARVRVAVASGKVQITTPSSTTGIVLTPGQLGDITDSTTHVSSVDDIAPGTEWVSGYLVFHHTPVAKVLQTISQWYGYEFHCADQRLTTRSVTIGISAQSSAEALAAIERVLLVNLTVTGDTVTLTPQSARPAPGTPRTRTYDVWTPTREVGR